METERIYRMYGLTPYNISPIQQGIQFGHAVQEFNNHIFKILSHPKALEKQDYHLISTFEKWAKKDKTFIILNGGTTNSNPTNLGSMNKAMLELDNNDIFYSSFYEPDLGDQLTALVFLVDDRVFDRENWPDYNGPFYMDGKTPLTLDYQEWKMKFSESEKEADQIIFLRSWLSKFRLA